MGLRWGYMGTGFIAQVVAEDFKIAGLHIQAVGSRHKLPEMESSDSELYRL